MTFQNYSAQGEDRPLGSVDARILLEFYGIELSLEFV